ncbi:putative rubredoxin reductase [Caenispirillum salinarum AK4]|uniref:Putative rubredoxin reductase n=1 Tax=Caenispirillum salinarum AK4 TaxID=1238182 RepID=K9H0R9_9PROT|nr:putative rubredoxin reductase [Caenispirillum salinarum AK4]
MLATGAAPIRLAVPGADALLPVSDLADHARLRARLQGARHVAIVGGGLIGCEFVNDLAAAGLVVTIVERAPRLMDALLPETASAALRAGLEDAGVTVRTGVALSSVATDADGVVLTVNGETVRADVGLSAVGLAPRLDLARAAGVDVGRGIRVDDCLRTSVPGTLRGFALVGRSAQSRRAEWLAAAGQSRRNVA